MGVGELLRDGRYAFGRAVACRRARAGRARPRGRRLAGEHRVVLALFGMLGVRVPRMRRVVDEGRKDSRAHAVPAMYARGNQYRFWVG
jgi:hypothetical protein